jgi:CheY-like chemotaxis protein
MELPKKQASVFKGYAEKSGSLKKFSDLHILIAEDNPVCWMVLKTILDREGCSVTVVENGLKAVEATKKEPYDLILMNGEMPIMGGLEATKEIRKMFNRQPLLIIGVTAHNLDQRARFLASGMDGYLTKPVEINRLKAEVLRCLEECKSKTEKLPELHILIAEDNPVNQLVLKTMLSREGCSVTVVENGLKAVKAVEAAKKGSYDLILMDGEMPIMDGLEATKRIRQTFSHQALPIIGVTAHVLDTNREQFLASGMDGYLTKPIDRDALKAEILRCVGTGLEE